MKPALRRRLARALAANAPRRASVRVFVDAYAAVPPYSDRYDFLVRHGEPLHHLHGWRDLRRNA